jgi:hypothetical protein
MEEGAWEEGEEGYGQDYYEDVPEQASAPEKRGFFSRMAAKVKGGKGGAAAGKYSVQQVDW